MMKKYLKAKIHNLRITEANVNYTGSITIDPVLTEAAGLEKYEMVMVVNIDNGERFETYVIEGKPGSGTVGLNGGAARKGKVGERIIVFSTIWIEGGVKHDIRVLITDENNKIIESKNETIET